MQIQAVFFTPAKNFCSGTLLCAKLFSHVATSHNLGKNADRYRVAAEPAGVTAKRVCGEQLQPPQGVACQPSSRCHRQPAGIRSNYQRRRSGTASPQWRQNMRSAAANSRQTTAKSPLSQYQKGSSGDWPATRRRITSPAYFPRQERLLFSKHIFVFGQRLSSQHMQSCAN